MENYNLHRRAQSGWHPTTYSRPVDKKPERNWAALMEAAKRPPVGYCEDAPRGIQFGGAGSAREISGTKKPDVPAPSVSSDDLYEPIGTMPVVGDEIAFPSTVTSTVMRATVLEVGVTALKNTGACPSWFLDGFRNGSYRILKRQPRKQVDGRVWKMDRNCAQGSVVSHWANIGGVSYWREDNGSWNRYAVEAGDRLGRASVLSELHGPEADAIIRDCAKAMGLDHETR